MVNEQGLLRAMKKAWNGKDGYTIASMGNFYYIFSDGWEVLLPCEILPRKILALAVEHIGAIPEDGEVYCCSKKGGAQMVSNAMVWEGKDELERLQLKTKGQRTSLTLNGKELWQALESLSVVAIDPSYGEIISRKKPGESYVQNHAVIWKDVAVVRVMGEYMPEAAETYLSGMQWIGGTQ